MKVSENAIRRFGSVFSGCKCDVLFLDPDESEKYITQFFF